MTGDAVAHLSLESAVSTEQAECEGDLAAALKLKVRPYALHVSSYSLTKTRRSFALNARALCGACYATFEGAPLAAAHSLRGGARCRVGGATTRLRVWTAAATYIFGVR